MSSLSTWRCERGSAILGFAKVWTYDRLVRYPIAVSSFVEVFHAIVLQSIDKT
jgi:hypothetical protein